MSRFLANHLWQCPYLHWHPFQLSDRTTFGTILFRLLKRQKILSGTVHSYIKVVYTTLTGEWYTVLHWLPKRMHVMWYISDDWLFNKGTIDEFEKV